MKINHWIYIVISTATAILLTVGRSGILPIFGDYTILDKVMNLFVGIIAPLFTMIIIFSRSENHYFRNYIPILILGFWVAICVITSPILYWPSFTAVITVALSLLIASQIERSYLPYVRYSVLLITAIFNIMILVFHQKDINFIFSGLLSQRLGVSLSYANVVIYPRVVYSLGFTCFVSIFIEKRIWLRIVAAGLIFFPILIGLSTGNRGVLIGFALAVISFIIGQRKWLAAGAAFLLSVILAIIGYEVIQKILPLAATRFVFDLNNPRIDIWVPILNNFTLFGRGVGLSYAHNIFLEFLQDYGVVGLLLFLLIFIPAVTGIWKSYNRTSDQEVLWVIGLFVMQVVAQQLSSNIFTGSFWAVFALVLALGWDEKREVSNPNPLKILPHFNQKQIHFRD